jgi:hypothetical protein
MFIYLLNINLLNCLWEWWEVFELIWKIPQLLRKLGQTLELQQMVHCKVNLNERIAGEAAEFSFEAK